MNNQNTMTSKDWDDIDRSSRQLLSCFLEYVGAEDIGETHGNCCIDLSCRMNNKAVALEIKDRSFPHDQYGDILVEDIKQDCTTRRIDKGQFDAAIAVNVFKDSIIALADMFDADAKHFKRPAPYSTSVKGGDRTYVLKDFCALPQRRKYKYAVVDGKLKFTKIS